MSKRPDFPKEHLIQRLWLSTLVFTVMFAQPFGGGFQSSVAAKPLLQTAALGDRLPPITPDRISPPPVDAVLANVRLKLGSQPRAKRTAIVGRSSRAIVTNRRNNDANRSLRGISHFIDTERNANLTPVNRFIDR